MVSTFLKAYRARLLFLFLQEQVKDFIIIIIIIIITHTHTHTRDTQHPTYRHAAVRNAVAAPRDKAPSKPYTRGSDLALVALSAERERESERERENHWYVPVVKPCHLCTLYSSDKSL
jgi:hypothetical protein